MDDSRNAHPDERTLSLYALGKLDDGTARTVSDHLERCRQCRARVEQIPADSFLGRVRDARPARATPDRPDVRGTISYPGRAASVAAPPRADTLPPGLADHPDYQILRELGRGGMGVVFLAHNRLMGRDEVLKVMGPQVVARPAVLDRFLREIRVVARLRHPNIVAAYSAVRIGPSIVFAMEFVDGLDLARMTRAKGPLPVAHACNFVYQTALGLQHAHEAGLVHRDIKPGNLMLSRRGVKGTVKILDFGLAKATREEKVDTGLTREGQALGTPDFIAPEQIIDAQSADIRADIYSLGGTLYYLLTGRPPFTARSLYDIYQAHISRDADPLNLVRPEVPAELGALVAKMMAKDPARRFQAPGEVAQALMPFFKRANAGPGIALPEVSQSGQANSGRSPAVTAAALHRPATKDGVTEAGATAGAEPPGFVGHWENLIDFGNEEDSTNRATTVAPRRRPSWIWPTADVPVLVLGLVIAWLGGGVRVADLTVRPGTQVARTEQPVSTMAENPEFRTPAPPTAQPVANLFPDGDSAFPQSEAEVLCNEPGLRVSAWNDSQFLYIQAIIRLDATDVGLDSLSIDKKDWSQLILDLDADEKVTPRCDRQYELANGLGYQISMGKSSWTVPYHDSAGRGAIRIYSDGERKNVRVDSYILPLAELGRKPGQPVRLVYWAGSPRLKVPVNSAGFRWPGHYWSYAIPWRDFRTVMLADRPARLDASRAIPSNGNSSGLLEQQKSKLSPPGAVPAAERLPEPANRAIFDRIVVRRLGRSGVRSNLDNAYKHEKKGLTFSVYESGGNLFAKSAFGRSDVLCTHPVEDGTPAEIDLGRSTFRQKRTLVIYVRGCFWGAGKGNRIEIMMDGAVWKTVITNNSDDWRRIEVPVLNERVTIIHHAMDWSHETLFWDFILE